MEKEVLEIKEVEVSFRERMKEFFASTKDKFNDLKLSIAKKKNMRVARREYESERLEAENYNRLDLAKKIGYTAIQGAFACGFASIAIVSAVALTPINVFMALPLTAVTFGAAWFCKNNFNESKVEFKNMLEKYNEASKKAKNLKLQEKEAKKAEKKTKKENQKQEKANKQNLFKKIVSKFKEHDDIDLDYDTLDIPELEETNLDIPAPEEMNLDIPAPEKIKKSKIDGITINPITKKVIVKGLKIKNRKGLGIYEVIIPKNDKVANSLAEQLLTQYEKLAEYETEEKKVITLRK